MRISGAFPSKYLKAADLNGEDVTVVIESVEVEEVGMGGQKEEKPVIRFKGAKKAFVCNKTNANIITKLYGDESDDWVGKPITLYEAEVEFQGDMVQSIRVRSKPPAAKAAAAKPAAKGKKAAEPEHDPAEDIDESEIPF